MFSPQLCLTHSSLPKLNKWTHLLATTSSRSTTRPRDSVDGMPSIVEQTSLAIVTNIEPAHLSLLLNLLRIFSYLVLGFWAKIYIFEAYNRVQCIFIYIFQLLSNYYYSLNRFCCFLYDLTYPWYSMLVEVYFVLTFSVSSSLHWRF